MTQIRRTLPAHELNARRRRIAVLKRLPALAPPQTRPAAPPGTRQAAATERYSATPAVDTA